MKYFFSFFFLLAYFSCSNDLPTSHSNLIVLLSLCCSCCRPQTIGILWITKFIFSWREKIALMLVVVGFWARAMQSYDKILEQMVLWGAAKGLGLNKKTRVCVRVCTALVANKLSFSCALSCFFGFLVSDSNLWPGVINLRLIECSGRKFWMVVRRMNEPNTQHFQRTQFLSVRRSWKRQCCLIAIWRSHRSWCVARGSCSKVLTK